MYKKRSGTSGAQGHLYESKLLSLILFKAQNNDNVKDLYLASNMDQIGAFDDICFKVNIKGCSKPLAVFIQAKHRENNDKVLSINSKEHLREYFNSYLIIKEKFNAKSQDKIFNEDFNKIDCFFIIYTNEKGQSSDIVLETPLVSHLNNLISTGKAGSQPQVTDENAQFLARINTATMLAKQFVKFLFNKSNENMMNDDYILTYHVVLAQYVVIVSETLQNNAGRESRACTFRQSFFCSTNEFLSMFRNELYREVAKKKKMDETRHVQNFESVLSSTVNVDLMGNFNALKSELLKSSPASVNDDSIYDTPNHIPGIPNAETCCGKQENFDETDDFYHMSALNILKSFKFWVPAAFGNIDLKIRGDMDNVERRLNNLTKSIIELIERSKPRKVITIHEPVTDGLLRLNGGLGSAVGNLLVLDQTTKLLKFTGDNTILKHNSRRLLEKLKSKVDNLNEYRFNIKDKKFPKLSFDCFDNDLAKDFLSKLVFYTNQGDQDCIERLLKQEIKNLQRCDRYVVSPPKFHIATDVIFLKYHDKIQKWRLSKKTSAPYLTKSSNLYQEAVNNIVQNPQLSTIHANYMNDKIIEHVQFNQEVIESFKTQDVIKGIILTETVNLTVIKVIQSSKDKEYAVLDLGYITKSSNVDFNAMIAELENLNKENLIILVCEDIENQSDQIIIKLGKISQALFKKTYIIITKNLYCDLIKKCFLQNNKIIIDEKHRFTNLNEKTQNMVLNNRTLIFQGEEKKIGTLATKFSFIDGIVLNDIIIKNNKLMISDSLSNSNYEGIKHLYVNRKLSRVNTATTEPGTLLDIYEPVVLMTGEAGMGKSTLLTHLALETKKLDKNVWIMRVNLLEHSDAFKELQTTLKDRKCISSLEMLTIICRQVIVKKKWSSTDIREIEINLKESHGEVFIEYVKINDISKLDRVQFELNMFLYFYNKGDVIFLFDGFDEIYPRYTDTVLKLLFAIKCDMRRNKMWITSRAYSEIEAILVQNFGAPYKLEKMTTGQLDLYLEKFWETNLILPYINNERRLLFLNKMQSNISGLVTTASLSQLLGRVYISLISYLLWNLNETESTNNCPDLSRTVKFLQRTSKRHKYGKTVTHHGEPSTARVDIDDKVDSPLFVHLAADYFVTLIKQLDTVTRFDVDVTTIYESFINSILQKHYEEKYKVNVNNAIVTIEFEMKLIVYKEENKQLAAYAIFYHDMHNIFDNERLLEIQTKLNDIKEGKEKTGLICSVYNDIPQFVHKTFAEFLAVEFLFDLMLTMGHERREILANILCNQIATLCVWVDQKLSKKEYQALRVYFADKDGIVVPFPAL